MAKRRETAAPVQPAPRGLLIDVLDCAFDKRSWHGPNLMGAIRGVDARAAAATVAGRKCVWEQVLHAAYWKHRVLTRIAGPARFPRRGSNWPAMPAEQTEAAWRTDVELLRDVHRRLRAAAVDLSDARLDAETVWRIHGAAAHDLYHAGQIKLMRRLTEDG
jgi:hypothetical protein